MLKYILGLSLASSAPSALRSVAPARCLRSAGVGRRGLDLVLARCRWQCLGEALGADGWLDCGGAGRGSGWAVWPRCGGAWRW